MKYTTAAVIYLFLFLINVPLSVAQIRPSRSFSFVPAEVQVEPGPLAATWFSGEIQAGRGSFKGEQAWQLRLHGLVELWRINQDRTLVLAFHHELTANPFNDISFNPRTARWEEQIYMQWVSSPVTWTIGIYHRCKHDVDNIDPPQEGEQSTYTPTRRAIILSGFQITLARHLIQTDNWRVHGHVGADYNIVSLDYRSPRSSYPASWENIIAVLRTGIRAEWQLTPGLYLAPSAWMGYAVFTDEGSDLPIEFRTELALRLKGRSTADLAFSYERQFDEVVFLVPQSTRVFSIGLRFAP